MCGVFDVSTFQLFAFCCTFRLFAAFRLFAFLCTFRLFAAMAYFSRLVDVSGFLVFRTKSLRFTTCAVWDSPFIRANHRFFESAAGLRASSPGRRASSAMRSMVRLAAANSSGFGGL